MLSERVKETRINRGYSQEKLAEKAGVSLRTVQRVENGKTDPQGDTLVRLAEALDVSPDDLAEWKQREDTTYLAVLNLSALSFLLFPLLGIILPLVLWITKKDQIKKVDENGRKLLNFQISWNLLLFAATLVYTIWNQYVLFTLTKISFTLNSNLLIPVYITFGLLYLYNTVIIITNAIWSKKGKDIWYYPRINFVR